MPGLAPAPVALTADPGTFAALGGEHVGMPGVGVAPAQMGVQRPGEHHMVGVIGAAENEERSGPKCGSIGLAQEA